MDMRYGTALVILAAASFLLPGVLAAGYVYEDWRFAATWELWPTLEQLLQPRGLSWLSFAVVAHLFGESARAQHLTNLGLHLVNGGLVSLVLGRFFVTKQVMWIGTAFFLLHPLQVEAVSYVSSRPDLLMTMGILVAVLCLTCAVCPVARDGESWWTPPRLSGLRWVGVSASFLFALWAKESAVAGVLLCLLLRPSLRLLVVCGLPSLAVSGIVVWRVGQQPAVLTGTSWLVYASQQAVRVWQLLGQILFPVGLTIDPDPGRVPMLIAVAGLCLLGLVLLVCLVMQGTTDSYLAILVTTGILWMLVALAPRLLPVAEALREHHFYLSMVGAALVIGRLLAPLFTPVRSYTRGVYA